MKRQGVVPESMIFKERKYFIACTEVFKQHDLLPCYLATRNSDY